MNRRHMLGSITTAVTALGLHQTLFAADDKPSTPKEDEALHAEAIQKCLDACTSCMNECNTTVHYAYEQIAKGERKFLDALHLTVDCQEFCAQSAKIMGRVSPMMAIGCQACADACEMCATECEKFPVDPQLTRCAQECRACAKSCQGMMKHHHHHGHHEKS